MSYFMRFFLQDGAPPTLAEIDHALRARDSSALLATDGTTDRRADLFFADTLYAEIELNVAGDEVFDEDCAELQEELAKQDDPAAPEVAQQLRRCEAAVVICVYEAGDDDTSRLNLLIDWLFATRAGLLQIDEEGVFDRYGKRLVALL